MGQIRVPLCRPFIGEEEIEAVAEVLRSGWLSSGPKVEEFERMFAEYVGAQHAIATSSCTASLHLSLVALGIGEGDEVITSPFTYTATAEAIISSGAAPVFADIDPETLNILPEEIERKVTPKTKAIMPVHIAGYPCRMGEIYDIAERFGLFVVSDAAHAISTEYEGVKIGAMKDLNCFSFYATKNVTTGEGGMITVQDGELASRLRLMRLHGIDRPTWARRRSGRRWYYEVVERGFKYNMSDIQAAIGIRQMGKLDRMQRRREEIARIYAEELGSIDLIRLPSEPERGRHSWHLYIIQLDERLDRDEFIARMAEKGVECGVHFIPLHLHPYYRKRFGLKPGDFPNAEGAFRRVVTLPLFPGMSDEDVGYVVESVKSVINHMTAG